MLIFFQMFFCLTFVLSFKLLKQSIGIAFTVSGVHWLAVKRLLVICIQEQLHSSVQLFSLCFILAINRDSVHIQFLMNIHLCVHTAHWPKDYLLFLTSNITGLSVTYFCNQEQFRSSVQLFSLCFVLAINRDCVHSFWCTLTCCKNSKKYSKSGKRNKFKYFFVKHIYFSIQGF